MTIKNLVTAQLLQNQDQAINIIEIPGSSNCGSPKLDRLVGERKPRRQNSELKCHRRDPPTSNGTKSHRKSSVCKGLDARVGKGAYELQGDKSRSRLAYQNFLALWKDADHDIPILQQPNAEYAKLQYLRGDKSGMGR